MPVVAIGATILAVFLPVAFAEGMIGKFFLDFGLTVSIAMAISVFEALTMAPLLSAYFFRKKKGAIEVELDELDHLEEQGFAIADELEDNSHMNSRLNRAYGQVLTWVLGHKLLAGVIAIAVIIASFSSVAFIDVTFLPQSKVSEFNVSMALPGGTPLRTTAVEATKVEQVLREHPAVEDVVTSIGGQGTPEKASFTVTLKDDLSGDISATDVIADLRGPLANVPKILFSTSSAASSMSGSTSDLTVEVVGIDGSDYDVLGQQAEQIADQLATMPGLADINVSYAPGRPEIQLDVDRRRASDLGLSTAQIASTVRLLLNGDVATTFRGEGNEADIRVQLSESGRSSRDDILNINLLSATGQLIPLRNVATIDIATSPNAISRSNRQPIVTVAANVLNQRNLPAATAAVTAMVEKLSTPVGISARMGGTVEDQADALLSLVMALLLGVVFVYMVLASQFGSLLQPILIMLAMPLAIAGAILALLLSGRTLDMTAMIGFIMLMGLVVKNSVLLVDFANRAHKKGASADEAMLIAGPVRLRPVLMTSVAMILAMIPVALGVSAGGEFRQPMAIAILGGLVTSTLLTLLVVPLSYGVVIGWQDKLAAGRARRRAAKAETAIEHEGGYVVADPQSIGD